MAATFTSLHRHGFRNFWLAMTISNVGFWMQRVGQDWLALQISGGSGVAVGIVVALQFLPILFLAPLGGVITDRLPRRKVLIASNAAAALTVACLAALTASGVVQLWMVYAVSFIAGCISAVDSAARPAIIAELVEPVELPNAVSLTSASLHTARLVGPAGAGLAIAAWGDASVFWISALTFVPMVIVLARLRPQSLRTVAPSERGQRGFGSAWRLARSDTRVTATLIVVFFTGTFGLNFQLTTALMATKEFNVGAGQFGLLTSAMAVGSVAGALVAARRRTASLRLVLGSALVFGVVEIVAGLIPTFWLFAAYLPMCGLAAVTVLTSSQVLIQLTSPDQVRGRLMALYGMCLVGGTPIVAPIIGLVADQFGPRWTLIGGGLGVLIGVAVAVLVWWKSKRRSRIDDSVDAVGLPVTTDELKLG